jgi:hypothetical protein
MWAMALVVTAIATFEGIGHRDGRCLRNTVRRGAGPFSEVENAVE